MAVPSWTDTVDNMFTSTWALRKTEAIEQQYTKTPFIYWMRKQGKIDTNMSGHRRIEIPLEYGTNDTVRWITKGSTVPLTEGELLTMAYEEWKYSSVTVMRYGTEDHQNKGKARLINYVETKINAAERSMWEEFESAWMLEGYAEEWLYDRPDGDYYNWLRNSVRRYRLIDFLRF